MGLAVSISAFVVIWLSAFSCPSWIFRDRVVLRAQVSHERDVGLSLTVPSRVVGFSYYLCDLTFQG